MYYIYILTNKTNKVLYIWVTNDIVRRINEHKQWLVDWFTKKYNCKKLVYVEEYIDINDAIEREKQLKNWHKEWKLNLIKEVNPLFEEILL